jgi:hypothetical protein
MAMTFELVAAYDDGAQEAAVRACDEGPEGDARVLDAGGGDEGDWHRRRGGQRRGGALHGRDDPGGALGPQPGAAADGRRHGRRQEHRAQGDPPGVSNQAHTARASY